MELIVELITGLSATVGVLTGVKLVTFVSFVTLMAQLPPANKILLQVMAVAVMEVPPL